MVANIKIMPVKKLLAEEEKFLNDLTKNQELIEFHNHAKSEIDHFIKSGTKVFQRKEIIFGEEELVKVSIVQSLASFAAPEISKTILAFNSNPFADTFAKLANAYLLDLLTFVAASENFEASPVSYVESDIGLLYIFTITLFPELIDQTEAIFLKGLDYKQKIRGNNIRPMKGSYGRDCILYLAYWLAREHKREECVINQLLSYCAPTIEPCYIEAIENVFSNNEADVQTAVDALAEYHIKNSNTADLTYPFHRNLWIYFPIEILSLLKIRAQKNFKNDFLSHALINIFLPFISTKVNIEFDTDLLKNRFFN